MHEPALQNREISDAALAPHLLSRFRASEPFREIAAGLSRAGASEAPAFWARGLAGSSRSLLAAALAETTGNPALVVCPDSSIAEDLRDDLNFLLGAQSAALFPDPGLEPYRAQHPRIANRAGRIEALAALAEPELRSALPACSRLQVLVATPASLSMPVPGPDHFRRTLIRIRVGQEIDPDDFVRRLVRLGYAAVPLVGEYGDISRRGGILDIYSFGRLNPVRMEFDGDEVCSLREFDPFSQRSLATLSEAAVLPLWEWIPRDEEIQALRRNLKVEGSVFDPELLQERIASMESDGTLEGIEWSLPLFGEWTGKLTDYLPAGSCLVIDGPTFVRSRHRQWVEDVRVAWDLLEKELLPLPPAPPERIFSLWEHWADLSAGGPRVYIGSGGSQAETEAAPGGPPAARSAPARPEAEGIAGATAIDFGTHPPERFGRNLEQTREYLDRLMEEAPEIHILCDTDNHRDRLLELLPKAQAKFHVGNLGGGFIWPRQALAVLTDHEIFSRLRRRTAGRRFTRGISLKELLALTPGDYVVHIDHGIGMYKGLERLIVNGQETDCIALEYAGGDRHYVPVDQLSLVQKYSAEEGHRPALSHLGGKSWARTKERVKKSIKDMAGELLKTYALRKSRKGYAFSSDTSWLRQLEASFPFEETPDQVQAIEEVKRDMESESPMDRLICGDVGYGKTEVAVRAAFKAVQDTRQVAVLVPTTLLARQHYDTFRERLKDYPVVVDVISRFRTAAESREIKQKLKEGKIDVIIGTHALLSKDVAFRDLGLVVVDEEQLFGVAAKEKLKQLRATVDVLTMTATPIPRTMHLALMGGRDMSTILTPPRDRRPIQTEILEFRDDVIAHALMREADRGGQSFFVHNRVETIDSMASYLGKLVPHLRLAVGHGQMRERALEAVMQKFLARDYDVLISTMIIESGLDLPNVNTILINRGDTFGLAQLYQLRGRVGRSSRKAYAFLLVPPYHSITEQAQKRLKAMEEFEDLGSGYQLALRDLEIRGAGNLLGAEQHGFIVNVGFDLYCQLLDEAVRELKGESKDEYIEPRMSTDIEAYLPDDYVPDPREKMNLYKSLADARSLERVEELAYELSDRFGRHPEPVRHLLGLRRIRILGAKVRCEKVTVKQEKVEIDLGRELKKQEIQSLMRSVPFPVEFLMGGRHRIRRKSPGTAEAVSTALILLRALDPTIV
jgi:transcription-repair coupling factor (superfamily II helicase)